jgi:hypothetical protein
MNMLHLLFYDCKHINNIHCCHYVLVNSERVTQQCGPTSTASAPCVTESHPNFKQAIVLFYFSLPNLLCKCRL